MQYQGVRSKTGWFGTRSMCPSGATCLPSDCCFSVQALYKFNYACWSGVLTFHYYVNCGYHIKTFAIIANSIKGRKIYFPKFFVTEKDVIVCFVRISALHANIDANDNKHLFFERWVWLRLE
jgi:hypothetical protein